MNRTGFLSITCALLSTLVGPPPATAQELEVDADQAVESRAGRVRLTFASAAMRIQPRDRTARASEHAYSALQCRTYTREPERLDWFGMLGPADSAYALAKLMKGLVSRTNIDHWITLTQRTGSSLRFRFSDADAGRADTVLQDRGVRACIVNARLRPPYSGSQGD